MKILITGGTGYIGSHTIIELISSGHEVACLDNYSNSSPIVLGRLKQITGKEITFYNGDVKDKELLRNIFDTERIDAVIHFAALKSVAESISEPVRYYSNNMGGLIALCEVMHEKGVRKLIFSSSATVYGKPESLPLTEKSPTGTNITNPYGQTKCMAEQILTDLFHSVEGAEKSGQGKTEGWNIVLLRYFNPIGAHESGLIGEDPKQIPANIMPFISQVAVGKLKELSIFGNDYDTPDGTAVRDYIHVVDLARGHVAAIKLMSGSLDDKAVKMQHSKAQENQHEKIQEAGDVESDDEVKSGSLEIFNLGTGKGVSVLEIVHAFEKATGQQVPYKIVGRRPGDIAACYANVDKAARVLGWKTEKSLEDSCRDAWKWQSGNPKGFE